MIKTSKQHDTFENVTARLVFGSGLQTHPYYSDGFGATSPNETTLVQVDPQLMAVFQALQNISYQTGGLQSLTQLLPQLQVLCTIMPELHVLLKEWREEKTLREQHPTVKSAYDNYKMTLKLCSEPDAN
jgi:hypothetical protein